MDSYKRKILLRELDRALEPCGRYRHELVGALLFFAERDRRRIAQRQVIEAVGRSQWGLPAEQREMLWGR